MDFNLGTVPWLGNILYAVVCFLLGNSPASEFYMLTFQNTQSHLNRGIGTYPPMNMEQTVCSKTTAYKIHTPGNCPEESIQHSEHGESLKSGILYAVIQTKTMKSGSLSPQCGTSTGYR